VIGKQRHRHREVEHDVRRQLPVRCFACLRVTATASSTASHSTEEASTDRDLVRQPTASSYIFTLRHKT
jgi:hypothetical protein